MNSIADVQALVSKLIDSQSRVEMNGNAHPSRKGLEIAKKLREIERMSVDGEGKIVDKATFDKVMEDVMFSLMAGELESALLDTQRNLR